MIKGCKAAHAISFHSDGTFAKWSTVRDFMENDEMDDEPEEEVVEEEAEEIVWEESIEFRDRFSLITKSSFIAIRAQSNHPEMFLVYRVEDKRTADENIMDSSGEHCVLKGEPYLVGKWFSFDKEMKKFVCYKESKTEIALIHVAEVISTDLELNEKHQMDIFEYRMLCARVYH